MPEEKLNYSLEAARTNKVLPVPEVPYRPPRPRHYRPRIGLIGCGGITKEHLQACQTAGYEVVALCDAVIDRAEKRRAEFFPEAEVYADYRRVLDRDDIAVVDLALHSAPRAAVIRAALEADKHVLSQKPFVTDLAVGRDLVCLARQRGLKLAVNQNGRWAPYLAFIRETARAGIIGTIASAQVSINWDHTWTQGTRFQELRHLILYDFGIHWFDAVASFFPDRTARRVLASTRSFPGQTMKPPMMAQVLVEFDHGLAGLSFNGHCRQDQREQIVVVGSAGAIRSEGPVCANDRLRLETPDGMCEPVLEGKWFNDGFQGTIGELLCAIEEDREPLNGAEENLRSLELCFAACASADTGQPQVPGQVEQITANPAG
jgi:predicted dehydrogenase